MIISRTPFRISFFGGGTDYPVWFEKYGGAVLATTIDKYCYITGRYLPPFFDHKHRISYSKIEHAKNIDDIKHSAAREAIKFVGIDGGVEIHHDADLPARTGLGSSSSFIVGMLHTLYALKGQMVDKMTLAKEAVHIEQKVLAENVGSQDQTMAAFGGFDFVEFKNKNDVNVNPVIISNGRLDDLNNHLMLFFTGFARTASKIAGEQIKKTPDKVKELTEMYKMVGEALSILNSENSISLFGELLHESWCLKKSLTNKISNQLIDDIYDAARSAGAIGGKLLGAGGGGFLLIFARPEDQAAIKEKLKDYLLIPFKFETSGSQIIFYNQSKSYE